MVGCAVAYSLARRGVETVILEAEDDLARGASGANSGILHTGFDSVPGELETRLILRSAQLRSELEVPVVACGALMQDAPAAVVERARANGVIVRVHSDGALEIPGESVTDPVAYTRALASAAAEVRLGARVRAIRRAGGGLALEIAGGEEVVCRVAVNCAGLFADEVARLAGDDSFEIYPRKGEFFVFDPPEPLDRIRLPAPDAAHQGRARVPDGRRQGDRRADRARPGRQARRLGTSGGAGRGAGQGSRDVAAAHRLRARSRATPGCVPPDAASTTSSARRVRVPGSSTSPPSARPGCRRHSASVSTWPDWWASRGSRWARSGGSRWPWSRGSQPWWRRRL